MATTNDADANTLPQSRKLIDSMLPERQQMLVLLWELSKLDFGTVDQAILDLLEDFKEVLVDYIAAGHFGLYQRIAEGKERRAAVLNTARDIYPRIEQSTDVAVEFSERYDGAEDEIIKNKLTTDLSRLAEEVTTRIDLEDQLITAMLGRDYHIPDVQPQA